MSSLQPKTATDETRSESSARSDDGGTQRARQGAIPMALRFAVVWALLLVAVVTEPSTAHAQVDLEGCALSPDGSVVAFQYRPRGSRSAGIGLFERATGKTTRIPRPNGAFTFHLPKFSPDGSLLTAIAGAQVVVVDLSTLRVTQVTERPGLKEFPTFQPDTGKILYATAGNLDSHLRLIDPTTRTDELILRPEDGFRNGFGNLSFLENNEVLFTAIGPKNTAVKNAVQALTPKPFVFVPYRLRFGELPEIAFRDVLARDLALMAAESPRSQLLATVRRSYSSASHRTKSSARQIPGAGTGITISI
jgi:hypothetical protein